MWSHTRKIINKSKLCHIYFFILLFFFGNAKFCHVRPVPPYPFWLSDESRSTCPALPCFMLIFFPSASSYAISYFSIRCRFVGQTASLQFYFEYLFFLQSSFARHLPNQTIIKWSSTVAPICKL